MYIYKLNTSLKSLDEILTNFWSTRCRTRTRNCFGKFWRNIFIEAVKLVFYDRHIICSWSLAFDDWQSPRIVRPVLQLHCICRNV